MKILAHGHYHATIVDQLPALKTLVTETTGETVRRVGRFIQLALIGAGRCLHAQTAPSNTAVYLTSGRGDLETTLEVLVPMIRDGQPPKPLSFINTVSNAACFYVSRQFALEGSSQFVTRRHAPLECALQLAALDLQDGVTNTALVGSVDICTAPLHEHRQRLKLSDNTSVGEGSHWFLLAPINAACEALATVNHVCHLADNTTLHAWLAENPPAPGTVLACGQQVSATLCTALQQQYGLPLLTAEENLPWYDSHTGHTLGCFLHEKPAQHLLHLDSDPQGCINVLHLSLCESH